MTGDARLRGDRDGRRRWRQHGSHARHRRRTCATNFPISAPADNPKRLQSAAVNLAAREAGAGRAHPRALRCACDLSRQLCDAGRGFAGRRGVASLVVPMDAVGQELLPERQRLDRRYAAGLGRIGPSRRAQVEVRRPWPSCRLRPEDFLQIGGYDETFSHNEDAEFDTRLRKAGGRIFLDADIRLTYLPRATGRRARAAVFQLRQGPGAHADEAWREAEAAPADPAGDAGGVRGRAALAPFSLWGLVLPGGYLAALVAGVAGGRVKHRSPCGLLAGLASATMHMSWSLACSASC